MAVETRAVEPAVLTIERRTFTLAEYRRMGEAGILHEDERVELIEGEIIKLTPIGRDHYVTVNRCNRRFTAADFREVAIVSVQNPVAINERSEPEPDIVLERYRADLYGEGEEVQPGDVLLLIEVSESSLRYDRDVKVPLYARGGIVEVWLLDLTARAILVFRDPSPEGYQTRLTVHRGERLSLAALPDREIAVADLLG